MGTPPSLSGLFFLEGQGKRKELYLLSFSPQGFDVWAPGNSQAFSGAPGLFQKSLSCENKNKSLSWGHLYMHSWEDNEQTGRAGRHFVPQPLKEGPSFAWLSFSSASSTILLSHRRWRRPATHLLSCGLVQDREQWLAASLILSSLLTDNNFFHIHSLPTFSRQFSILQD